MRNLENPLRDWFYLNILRRKYYRTGKCNCCGACCEKIYVKHGKAVLQEEDLFEKLKTMHPFYDDLNLIGKDETGLIFSCKNLDAKTRKCKKHGIRAKICRDYPQEELFTMGGTMGENCGFKFTPIVSFATVLKQVRQKPTLK